MLNSQQSLIDINDLPRVARGTTAEVLQVKENYVVKVFHLKNRNCDVTQFDNLEHMLERLRNAGIPLCEPSTIVKIKGDSSYFPEGYKEQGIMMPLLSDLKSAGFVFQPQSPQYEDDRRTIAHLIGRLHGAGIVIGPSYNNGFSHAENQIASVFYKTDKGFIVLDWANLAPMEWIISQDNLNYHNKWISHMDIDLRIPLNFTALFGFSPRDMFSRDYFDGFRETCLNEEFGKRYHEVLVSGNNLSWIYTRHSFEEFDLK